MFVELVSLSGVDWLVFLDGDCSIITHLKSFPAGPGIEKRFKRLI